MDLAVIAVVGSLNMDLVIRAPRQPFLGETLMGSSFGTAGGGKGANQALACARLGAQSCMVGCVGNDDFGNRLKATLTEAKVNCDHIELAKDTGTGVAVITVTDSGDNTIVLASGANAVPDSGLIERSSEVFKKADAVLFQLEIPLSAVKAGLLKARTCGCKTVLTPAPAQELEDELWPLIDYLVLNETELAFYSSSKRASSREEVVEAASALRARGVANVVVTRGAQGGVIVTKQDCFDYSPFEVEAVDTTGAGDAFCAALIVGLSEGMTLMQACRFASAAGALACTRIGAHPSLPWRHEVEELLEQNKGLPTKE